MSLFSSIGLTLVEFEVCWLLAKSLPIPTFHSVGKIESKIKHVKTIELHPNLKVTDDYLKQSSKDIAIVFGDRRLIHSFDALFYLAFICITTDFEFSMTIELANFKPLVL